MVKYRNHLLPKLTERGRAGKSHGLLLHDRGQCGRQLVPLQLQFDELHGDGELHLVHPPVIVHIGQGPADQRQGSEDCGHDHDLPLPLPLPPPIQTKQSTP